MHTHTDVSSLTTYTLLIWNSLFLEDATPFNAAVKEYSMLQLFIDRMPDWLG